MRHICLNEGTKTISTFECMNYVFRPRSYGANGKIKFDDDEKEFCESMDELSCAAKDGTGFWYNSCSAVNLNGRIFKSNDDNLKNKDGMIWVEVYNINLISLI